MVIAAVAPIIVSRYGVTGHELWLVWVKGWTQLLGSLVVRRWADLVHVSRYPAC